MSEIVPTNEQRRIIYQARRGLKELDYYIDSYAREHYLLADSDEQVAFEKLLKYEDPDLLLFFLNQAKPEDVEVEKLIGKMKQLKHRE